MRYCAVICCLWCLFQSEMAMADRPIAMDQVPLEVKGALEKLAANEGTKLEGVSIKEGGQDEGLYVGSWHVGNNVSEAVVSSSGIFAAMDQTLNQNDLPTEVQAMVRRIFPEKVPSDVTFNRKIAVSYEIDFVANGTKKIVSVNPAGKLLKVDEIKLADDSQSAGR